jgi:hypothetical protein
MQKKQPRKLYRLFDILVGVQGRIESIDQFCVAQLGEVGTRQPEVKHGV